MKKDADNMNRNIKAILTVLLLAAAVMLAGCAPEVSPYEANDAQGYCVSVRFDANGGRFTTNTSVIVDSYNIADIAPDDSGKVHIALLSPDNALRGNDAFMPVNNGYFLAGWYARRTETADGFTYEGKWDFEKDKLAVDARGDYRAAEPVLTLYAAWVPLFQIDFYDLGSGEYLDTMTYNPLEVEALTVPAWDEATGAMELYDFPARSGYTFAGAYLDAKGTQKVETKTLSHSGSVDEATGTAKDPVMDLYVDWTEGEWYRIYNVEQFLDNASVSGNYEIYADLDFTGEIWPSSLMHGNFSGTIQGNGYTFSNITFEQTNNSKVNSGLFGNLTEDASIQDLKLDNVNFTIAGGTRVAGASFGLLAGTISDKASLENVTIANSTLQIDSRCYFGVDDYSIGLVCGMGSSRIDDSGIACAVVGEADSLWAAVENGQVTLSDVPPETEPVAETIPEETAGA